MWDAPFFGAFQGLCAEWADVLENADADLTPMMRNLINVLWSEWKLIEQQLEELNNELERICAGCTCIRKMPGIGPVVATAIVAAIGNGAAFQKGGSSPPVWASCRVSTQPRPSDEMAVPHFTPSALMASHPGREKSL